MTTNIFCSTRFPKSRFFQVVDLKIWKNDTICMERLSSEPLNLNFLLNKYLSRAGWSLLVLFNQISKGFSVFQHTKRRIWKLVYHLQCKPSLCFSNYKSGLWLLCVAYTLHFGSPIDAFIIYHQHRKSMNTLGQVFKKRYYWPTAIIVSSLWKNFFFQIIIETNWTKLEKSHNVIFSYKQIKCGKFCGK
jgi:hypothetical protein